MYNKLMETGINIPGNLQDALTTTKLNPPPVREVLVARPRLFERLNQGLAKKLILISTPAGFGKTMLLSAWAARSAIPIAWISLDDGDNDPARFSLLLAAALDKILPGTGSYFYTSFTAARAAMPEEVLSKLINEIARMDHHFALILDDYHLINEPSVHASLVYLLEHLPPQMHVIVSTRADPPLPLARLRARSELAELRLADLCFTQNEARQFLQNTMHLQLGDHQIALLTDRTEGWISGLQLAAISLKTAPDPNQFIESFSGSNRFILDYLVEEVLKGQDEAIRTFLLKTSFLDRLSGPLCDVVTGLDNCQKVLEELERSNLFIIPLDEQRVWYRYHQLFLDLLQKQARQRWGSQVEAWQLRASQWFEEQGYIEDAIEYALAGRDHERAAFLLEKAAQPILLRSEIHTFRSWVKCLPEREVLARPDLVLFYAWTLQLTDSPSETVETWLNRVDASQPGIASKIGIIRGYGAFMLGEVERSVNLLRSALPDLPEDAALFRSVTGWLLSLYFVTTGDFQAGSNALEEVVRISLQKNHLIVAGGALCALAEVHLRMGQLYEAKEDYEQALAVARGTQGRLPVAARALMGLGELWREWNDLQLALQLCQEGIDLVRFLRESAAIAGYITLARIHQADGKWDLSREAIQKAWELAQQTSETGLDDLFVRLYRVNLETLHGNLGAGERWMTERSLCEEFNPADLDQKDDYYRYHILKYELLVAARWLIASGQPDRAVILLPMLLSKLEEQGRIHQAIEALLLIALAHHKLGNPELAQGFFERCLAAAEPGGYKQVFLQEGQAVLPLLRQAARGINNAPYARRLLAAFETHLQTAEGKEKDLPSKPARTSELAEPLSERELEILTCVAEGLSNREIASRLFISLPTVKWHTGNIFSKMDVSSRTMAVAKARSMGILPPG